MYTISDPKEIEYYHFPEEENFTGVVKDKYGDIFYYVNGKYHREGGPAVIWADGHIAYYLNGKFNREDDPAIIWSNGTKAYYLNGNLHREDGPVIIDPNGRKEYWLNNKKLKISTNQELKDYLTLRMFE